MFRLSGLMAIVLAFCCGALLFWTGQSVQRAEKKLKQTYLAAEKEEESVRVLSTEWDYLNRPDRIEKLIVENFDPDQKEGTSKVFIDAGAKIPEPVIPVLPRRKPQGYLQEVSTQKPVPVKKKKQTPVIQNKEREDFNSLLGEIMKEGQE